MAQNSLQNSDGKVVFLAPLPPWAPTGVKAPWSLKKVYKKTKKLSYLNMRFRILSLVSSLCRILGEYSQWLLVKE